jgi:NADP-dependent 3-hydroxy acid dehydrogenase YdfG
VSVRHCHLLFGLRSVVVVDRKEDIREFLISRRAKISPEQAGIPSYFSSIAGRVAWNGYGVYNLTKFGVNGFTESLRQEITQMHVRVGVLEPGGVDTELGSHNSPEVRGEMIDPFYEQTEVLAPEDIADGVDYMVTRPRHASIAGLWIMPTEQA